jgi:hypothetical protein
VTTRNMAFQPVMIGTRRVLIALHTKSPPSEAEWNRWTQLLEEEAKRCDFDFAQTPNLVLTDGGAPSTAQRTAVNVLIAQARTLPSVALVTDSVLVRAMVRAFSIFNPRIKVFTPAQMARAVVHLGLVEADVPALISALVTLEGQELGAGAVDTLGAVSRLSR